MKERLSVRTRRSSSSPTQLVLLGQVILHKRSSTVALGMLVVSCLSPLPRSWESQLTIRREQQGRSLTLLLILLLTSM